ncbi:MAG: EAL domain-containing protein [Chloroflexota bacterium]|nr:EAL domain-containing protein [Chloroflexota bacterium]
MTRFIPAGRLLPDDVWRARHRIVLLVLWLHVPIVVAFALAVGEPLSHSLLEALIVAVTAVAATPATLDRTFRSVAASFGLMSSSAVLVHLSGGYIELHFHFFVMVALMAIYQEWIPFLVAIGYVVVHHAILGLFLPHEVFNHPAAAANPMFWALVHGGFILGLSVVCVLTWSYANRALVDPLSGLANRTLFIQRTSRSLRSSGGARPLAVLYVDLDDFKHVNDSVGHAFGDELLTMVADRLSSCVRPGDTAARLSGDEFAVLLENVSIQEAAAVGRRILDVLDVPFIVQAKEIYQRATIGIAVGHGQQTDADTILRDADMAMYDAKGRGKGQMAFFRPELHTAHLRRLEFEGQLRRAIARDEFVLHYQPIVDLVHGGVVELEALVRWQHPERGLLPPEEFVGLAEETGLIKTLGHWVLQSACQQLRDWQEQSPDFPARIGIAVNVSTRELRSSTFVDQVRETLRETGVAGRQLTLEVTETVLLADAELVAERLAEIRSLGVRVAIDDFGSGYSSLKYLERLPVDVLKIDGSFVAALKGPPGATAVLQVALAMGSRLGFRTVAEGVEDSAQLRRLTLMGCRFAQGFLFSPPVEAQVVPSLAVRSWSAYSPGSSPELRPSADPSVKRILPASSTPA